MICKNHKPFEMPEEIIDSAIKGKLTIFAGAGISTENNSVLPFTFYDEIKGEMNLDNTSIEFDKLMSLYVNGRKNGRKRLLLQKIFYRFDRINAFSRTKKLATRFHNEIATIPHLNEIFTTNWDNFFETDVRQYQ